MASSGAQAQEPEYTDAFYLERFAETFTRLDDPLPLDAYATPARYDAFWMGDSLIQGLADLRENKESIFWGWSYRMMSLNEMYRATGDARYLKANLLAARTVDSLRDDRNGVALWTGVVAPVWSSPRYAQRDGPAVHPVHTGMVTYPLLELVLLAREAGEAMAVNQPELDALAASAIEALEYHAYQWVEGPGAGEGHYVGRNQEALFEGIHLPGNRLSAIGRAHWRAWQVTGDEAHRDKAVKLGWFIRNRLTPMPDGRIHWNYALAFEAADAPGPGDEIPGEDMSHGSLTLGLPALLAAEGEVFTATDMRGFCNTVIDMGRLGEGVLLANVTGKPTTHPRGVAVPGRWLRVTPWCPKGYETIAEFLRLHIERPSPLDLALLIRYRPQKQETHR